MNRRGFFALAMFLAASALQAETLTPEQLEKHIEEGKAFFLDVREPDEIRKLGSVPGYVNIPLGELEKRISEVPKDKVIVTMCNRAVRAGKAADLLTKAGYTVAGACALNDYKEKGKKLVYPEDKAEQKEK